MKNFGYNISRLGNKQEDYKNSNLEFPDKIIKYRYKIICKDCDFIYYRQRLSSDFDKKYRCGKCKGKLRILNY